MDLKAYTTRARRGPCFVCAFVSGHPDFHVVREVALAMEDCVGAERTHLYQQQFASLMAENGVLAMEPEETSAMAARIRDRIAARGGLNM